MRFELEKLLFTTNINAIFLYVTRYVQLTFLVIFPVVTSLNITCSYKKTNWKFIGEHYQCQTTDLKVITVGEHVENVIGDYSADHSNNDVKSISVDGQVCHHVPQFQNFFVNIEGLQVMSSSLKAITKDDLEPFPKLKVLNLYKNELSSVPADLFVHTPLVKWINFNNNQIRSIGAQIFDLAELEEIRFDGNLCLANEGSSAAEIEKLKQEVLTKCQPPQ